MRRMFSEKQIEKMIEEPLTSGELDIVAKTLKQRQANYLYEFEVLPSDETNFEKAGEQYCRFEEVNGELHIIICAQFKNKDTSSHTLNLKYQDIENIPEDIGSKIYDMGGKNLTEAPSADYKTIRVCPVGLSGSSGIALYPCRIEHSGLNKITIYQPQGVTVNANGYGVITLEVNLSLM